MRRARRAGGPVPWLVALLVGLGAAPAAAEAPWRLDDLLGLPEALSVSLVQRTRYEYLDDPFRPRSDAADQIVALRTLLHVRFQPLPWLTLGGELQDSRAFVHDASSFLNTGVVNPVELLQAYVELSGEIGGRKAELRAGRITLNVGSRRFVARNRTRNTINGFTGVDARIEVAPGHHLRGFYLLPVQRRPSSFEALREDQIHFDREGFEARFWGLFYETELPWEDHLELFVFGLGEDDDRPNRLTRNRQLVTPGFRVYREQKPARLDYTLEAAFQLGESRANASSVRDLDHRAGFVHVDVGYTAAIPAAPRFGLEYDYASGDENLLDGHNARFDTLFGARRFDFGPTAIYGPFARSNLHSPGVRLTARLREGVRGLLGYRAFWLEEARDLAGATGLVDPSGESGRYLGSQLELRLRWELVPGTVELDLTYAHLFAGDFFDRAPLSPARGDADFAYVQMTLTL